MIEGMRGGGEEGPPDPAPTRIRVCRALSCTLNGSAELLAEFERALGVRSGQTTADGRYCLQESFCFGRCALSAVVRAGERFYSRLSPGMAGEVMAKVWEGRD